LKRIWGGKGWSAYVFRKGLEKKKASQGIEHKKTKLNNLYVGFWRGKRKETKLRAKIRHATRRTKRVIGKVITAQKEKY